MIFLLQTAVLLLYSSRNITDYQTHLSAVAQMMGLHCIFCLMFRKNHQFYLFIPLEPEAVNQGFGYDSVSGCPVPNKESKSLSR